MLLVAYLHFCQHTKPTLKNVKELPSHVNRQQNWTNKVYFLGGV